MKSNFVASAYKNIWLPNAKRLFAVDPYIAHVLEQEGHYTDYEEVQVAPPSCATREEFLRDHEFVDRKFHQYSDILAHRLDKLHGSSHGVHFWRKAFSLSILRHVSLCYELFKACETHLNPTLHDCRVLDQASYCIPVDFDAHRQMFQNTDLGQEQLFSVYCGLFHPGKFMPWKDNEPQNYQQSGSSNPQSRRIWRQRLNPFRVVRKIVDWLLRARSPVVGIIDCSFSPEYRDRLAFESVGRIQTIQLPVMPFTVSAPQWDLRDQLACHELGFDRFDKFAFACLRHGMPKLFVEDFTRVYEHLNAHFNSFPDLRWVVCEWWIGQTYSALALAILRQRGVKHIYNEHNYIAYPFLGNNLKYIYPLVDKFITIGWENKSVQNLVRGASLFRWSESDRPVKEHDLLFISSIPNTRAPETNSCYGESGARAVPSYLKMNCRFLGALNESTLGSMVFRAYPALLAEQALAWNQKYILRGFLSKVKLFDDTSTSARLLMQRSRLTVVNYLSTSYLEALVADVPTVILLNKEAYMLEESHTGFFDALVAARICHTDPVEAARFVEQIKNDPESWWQSLPVRRARAAFLKANVGAPDVLIKYLVDLVREPHSVSVA